MYAIKNPERITTALNSKLRRLQTIRDQSFASELRLSDVMANASSYVSTTEEKCKIFRDRSNKAGKFIEELNEVILTCRCLNNLSVVSRDTLAKERCKSEVSVVSFNGTYCKIVHCLSNPSNERWLIYVAPVESIFKN